MKLIRNIFLGFVALTIIIIIATSLLFSGAIPQTSEEKALREKIMATQKSEQPQSDQPQTNP